MSVAIIGGSGFIGGNLSCLLNERKIDFFIVDIKKPEHFPDKWIYGDVTDKRSIYEALNGASSIINLAAEHKDNVSPIELYYKVNVEGASNVCEAASLLNIKHITFTSSVAVYGFVEKETAEDGEFKPFNHYGKSKLQAEYVYDEWQKGSPDNNLVTIRPTVVFGKNNRGNVYNLFKQIASGRFLMIGSGNNKKSMAYVGNIAAFILFSLNINEGRKVFNYIDKPDYTMNELVTIINKAMGKESNNIRIPYLFGLLGGYIFDFLSKITGKEFPVSSIRIKKFCAMTQFKSDSISFYGFNAPYSLEEGISTTVKHEFLR
ncbi:NAD-dependent epimerase/dehydratase family protein [Mixta calida]|uniref:NAD-dependent epimerase/dehydratase family protein n=1 Tax=Mixta calida TaxID=665913 RepID=UPI00403AB393